MCEQYIGWSNYETWALKHVMSNNEGLHNVILYLAEKLDVHELAVKIKELIQVANPLIDWSEHNVMIDIFRELANCALSQVNFNEIAEAYKNE